ncbi:MAG: SGNH/GDSL hydrolase family protein [Proteobacteria bacterium]|nr:SGNH/GDSL hydrolase family protein [Pseudomonadota bacterium]
MKAAKVLAINLLVLFVLLALAEGVCRLAGWGASPAVEPYIADWQQKFGGVFSLTGGAVLPPVNAEGFRDVDHTGQSRPGVVRVACIGDSVVYGYGVPFSGSLSRRLEEVLGRYGVRAEVFNFSRPGWSPLQYRLAYERHARPYLPGWVILGCCLNDIPELQNNLEKPPAWLTPLVRHSALVRAAIRPERAEIARVEELFTHPDHPKVQNGYRLFFREIQALAREVERDGARLAVLLFPFRFQVLDPGFAPLPQEAVRSFCSENGILYVDVASPLIRAGECAFVDYGHLSPLGAEVAARVLAARLFLGPVRTDSGPEQKKGVPSPGPLDSP